MERSKPIKEIDYEYISKILNLPTEQGFRHFYVKSGSPLIENASDRSIRLDDAIIMWICRAGSCMVGIDGTTHTLSAGQMLIVFAGVYCRFSAISTNFEADTILARINKNNGSNSLEKSFSKGRQLPILNLSKQEDVVLTQWIHYTKASMENGPHFNRVEHDNAILAVLRGELMGMYMRRSISSKEPTQSEQIVSKFERSLASHYILHRDVEWYAKELGLSPKRFSSRVKRITGKSPSDLIADEVIKNTKRLLLNSSLSSSEIAERLNFATPSFFCRYFKRYAGMTPQEWRSKNTLV